MRKFVLIIPFVLSLNLHAQIDLAAGMGIGFVNNSSLQDYINGLPLADDLSTFNSSFEFYLEGDYSLSPGFQLGLEYVYTLFSLNSSLGGIGQYDLTYVHHKPSVLAYYVVAGQGYKFKFGGGAGLRIVDLDEKILDTVNYTSSGFGLLARIQAHTKISTKFYVNIGSTLRYDFPGEPEKNGVKKFDVSVQDYVNINSLSVSVDIGFSYFIGE